jgi:hypothetical protein
MQASWTTVWGSPLIHLQHTRVILWLYDNNEFRIEAHIIVRAALFGVERV